MLVAAGMLVAIGAGCAKSTDRAPEAQEATAPVSTSTIRVTSPIAGSTVGEVYQLTGQAPAGQNVYAAAMVGESLASLTFIAPDAQGNFSMEGPSMDTMLEGDFILQFYNLDEDYNWVNTLDVPLKFAR